MSAHAESHLDPDGSSTAPPTFMQRHHFLMRRLHSLSGIVPVGLFVIMHLFTNAQILWGQDADGGSHFQHEVDFIHATPALFFVEVGLWSAIAFHAGLGFYYTFSGAKLNVDKYHGAKYGGNVRYTLQRVTGIVAFLFIFLHIATLRWRWELFGWFTPFYARWEGHEGEPLSLPLTAYALQYSWLVVVFYAVGVLSVIYHWSNGLWTSAITWGVTISKAAQKRWGFVCMAMGLALTVFFGAAVVGALQYDLDKQTTPAQREAINKVFEHHNQPPVFDSKGGATAKPAPAHP